ncbi:MAG: dihydrofolate reductase family protein [bacterium]
MHVTLDGVVQGPGSPDEDPSGGFEHGGWSRAYRDESIGRRIMETCTGEIELLLGRRTYEIWADYWPDNDDNPIGRTFNATRKYVATNTLSELSWANSEIVPAELAGSIREIKEQPGPELHIWGSGNLLQSLTAAGLVDEYRMFIYPLVLGQGKRMFEAGLPRCCLSLVESMGSDSGIVLATYRPSQG